MNRIPTLSDYPTLARFLKAYADFVKGSLGGNRVAEWAQSLGFRSRITFKKVTAGKRPIYPDEIKRIETTLDLSFSERALMNDKILGRHDGDKTQEKYFVSEEFFQTPLNTIILNLCGLEKSLTRAEIVKTLSGAFKSQEIEESIDRLLNLKLIGQSENWLKRIFHGSITTPPGQKFLSSKSYFKSTYEMADKAWEFPLDKRELQAFTIRLRADDIPRLKEEIRKLRHSLYELGKNGGANAVFQCSFAAFPVYMEEQVSSESEVVSN